MVCRKSIPLKIVNLLYSKLVLYSKLIVTSSRSPRRRLRCVDSSYEKRLPSQKNCQFQDLGGKRDLPRRVPNIHETTSVEENRKLVQKCGFRFHERASEKAERNNRWLGIWVPKPRFRDLWGEKFGPGFRKIASNIFAESKETFEVR